MIDFDEDAVKEHEVRLFPTVRIGTEREAELRSAAALCSMLCAVSEFGRVVVRAAGGPAGQISCFTEVEFPSAVPDGQKLRPDAILRVVRGKTEWKALLEFKVGDNPLEQSQFDEYHRIAKDAGFDALVTISSQTARPDGLPPLVVDGRRLKSVPVTHLSWDRLLSEARVLSRTDGVSDADQRWMLNEWIRYVADPSSRIIADANLGDNWNEVLRAAREGNLVAAARFLPETVDRWEGFLRKLALRLRAQLGVDVERWIPRGDRKDPDAFIKRLNDEVLRSGVLSGVFRVPDAVGEISIEVGLQGKTVRYGVTVDPPTEGRSQTRVNWLVRQLKGENLPPDLVIRIEWNQGKVVSMCRIADARTDPSCLLRDPHQQPVPPDSQPRRFYIEWTTSLSKGRARSTAPILDAIAADLERFYRQIVEQLVPYVPKAPKMPSEPTEHAKSPIAVVETTVAVAGAGGEIGSDDTANVPSKNVEQDAT